MAKVTNSYITLKCFDSEFPVLGSQVSAPYVYAMVNMQIVLPLYIMICIRIHMNFQSATARATIISVLCQRWFVFF